MGLLGKYLCMLQHPSLRMCINSVGQSFPFSIIVIDLIWWYICFTDCNDPGFDHACNHHRLKVMLLLKETETHLLHSFRLGTWF